MQAIMPRCAKYRHIVFPGAASRLKNLSREAAPAEAMKVRAVPSAALPAENVDFFRWLFRRAGLDAHAYRPETLQRRIAACLRLLRVPSVSEARRLLQRTPELVPLAVSALVLGVTAFFRDRPVFDDLRHQVLPVLEKPGLDLRIWSVGCSDGAELYSVAMVLADMGLAGRACLLGTDCRADAIERARGGSFDALLMKSVPPNFRARYFVEESPRWRLRPALRSAVRWRTASVLEGEEPGPWDLILCRNLAMYLQPEVIGSLWERLEAALRPGGVLVLGKAERPSGSRRLSLVGPCIYRRTRG